MCACSACSRLQLRRREAGWRAAGGDQSVVKRTRFGHCRCILAERLLRRAWAVFPCHSPLHGLPTRSTVNHRLESRTRENRTYGSEVGAAQLNAPSLPLSANRRACSCAHVHVARSQAQTLELCCTGGACPGYLRAPLRACTSRHCRGSCRSTACIPPSAQAHR